jgi:hypothetical protein
MARAAGWAHGQRTLGMLCWSLGVASSRARAHDRGCSVCNTRRPSSCSQHRVATVARCRCRCHHDQPFLGMTVMCGGGRRCPSIKLPAAGGECEANRAACPRALGLAATGAAAARAAIAVSDDDGRM